MTTQKARIDSFRNWMEAKTNSYAESCSDYARSNQESPPESLSFPYEVFSETWDAFEILVDRDDAYKPSRNLQSFLQDYSVHSTDGTELFGMYIRNSLPTVYGYSDYHIKALNSILKKFGKVDTND